MFFANDYPVKILFSRTEILIG